MLVVEHQNVHPLLAYWPHPSPLAFFALIIITNGERDTENTNRSSFPVTRLPKCHASYEMRTNPMECLCFKSVNNCMLCVMGDKQHRMGLAELCNHGNFQRPLPCEGRKTESLPQSGGPTSGPWAMWCVLDGWFCVWYMSEGKAWHPVCLT